MSLRLLFLLMGLVTAVMIAGVVYTKVISPSPELTVGEQRSVDRVCDTRCGSLADQIAAESEGPEDLQRRVRVCLEECKAQLGKARPGR